MILFIQKYLFIGIAGALLVACSDEIESENEVVRPVRFAQVGSLGADRSLKFTGITKADEKTELSFKVGGTIISLDIASGKRIKKGDLIAKLDSGDAKLKLENQVLSLGKVKIQMETAKSNMHRIRGLYENDNVPLGEYESAKEKYSNANASYKTEKHSVDLTRRELGYYQLLSPADGIILSKSVSINENIQPGQLITAIQSGDALSVEVGMPEQYIVKIKKGQLAEILLPSITDTPFDGVITDVAYTVKPDSSTYPVTVTINNPSDKIRPGMAANVLFNFQADKPGSILIVPAHSVAKSETGNFVFMVVDVADGIGKVHKVPITVGRLTNSGFEVIKGIKIGDKVITAGVSSLEEGMKVRLLK